MQQRILIVDDEPDILTLLEEFFSLNGYAVSLAAGGMEALKKAAEQPDLILLDINMPDVDGLSVCSRIREFVSCPILFLTARVEDSQKVEGFAAGGDDYILKPFSLEELGARVAAHLRREQRRGAQGRVRFDARLAIDYAERCAYYDNIPIPLAKKEFDIVEYLSRNRGLTFDKERIYEAVWGWDSEGSSNVVAEHVRRIRAKFTQAGAEPYVETVWGVGYKWKK